MKGSLLISIILLFLFSCKEDECVTCTTTTTCTITISGHTHWYPHITAKTFEACGADKARWDGYVDSFISSQGDTTADCSVVTRCE